MHLLYAPRDFEHAFGMRFHFFQDRLDAVMLRGSRRVLRQLHSSSIPASFRTHPSLTHVVRGQLLRVHGFSQQLRRRPCEHGHLRRAAARTCKRDDQNFLRVVSSVVLPASFETKRCHEAFRTGSSPNEAFGLKGKRTGSKGEGLGSYLWSFFSLDPPRAGDREMKLVFVWVRGGERARSVGEVDVERKRGGTSPKIHEEYGRSTTRTAPCFASTSWPLHARAPSRQLAFQIADLLVHGIHTTTLYGSSQSLISRAFPTSVGMPLPASPHARLKSNATIFVAGERSTSG